MRYCLLGVIINGFLKFLINWCAQSQPSESLHWDEDDPGLSFAEKQAIRLGKCRHAVLDPDFEASCPLNLGHSRSLFVDA